MYPARSFIGLLRMPRKIDVQYSTEKEPFKLDKVLLLNKASRLEIERLSQPNLNEHELQTNIRKRGLDYDVLVENHKINTNFQEKVHSTFKNFGVKVRSVNRFTCSSSDFEWCDAVFPLGGDGTFLHAARYIPNRNKPVVGFNSNPSTSEGFLCLPKQYSSDIASAISKLKNGKFKWVFRTRIRVVFTGKCEDGQMPTELHTVKSLACKLKNIVGKIKTSHKARSWVIKQRLPVLALNEVFMSEVFAAKVSLFHMKLNNSEPIVKVKSSGLCVCTGTGSTSWNLSINRLSRQEVSDIIKLYVSERNETVKEDFESLVTKVSNKFNNKFKFDAEDQCLGYTIRDLISLGVWPSPKGLEPRGYANTIEVKSMCVDAAIIIDGGVSFPFEEGSIIYLETHPEDALRTVQLLD